MSVGWDLSNGGALPAGWALAPLGDLLTGIEAGKSFKCDERPPLADEVGVVKVSAVTWGEYREQESKTCTDASRINPDLYIRAGDFLFSRANTIELVGACVIARKVSRRVMLSDKILRFHFASDDMKEWVLQYMRSDQGREQIELLASGNQDSMRNIGQERIGQVLVPLPPNAERTEIVTRLDALLSELAAGANELIAAKRKLAAYRQSLLKAAVEGYLSAEWRASNPPQETGADLLARMLRERPSAPESAAASASGLPPSWVWASAAQLCGFITKGTTPPKGTADGEPKTVPFLRVTNLTQTGALDFSDQVFVSQATHQEFLARSRVVPGDVLMNIVGPPLGQVSLVPDAYLEWNINQAIAIFRPVSGVSNLYLRVALLSPVAQRWLKARAKTTAGQTNLTLELCRALPIRLPPLTEQIEIARLVDEGLEALDTLDASIRRMLEMAAAQRQNILRAAFSGQLIPQDRADESAVVLLARIRAERDAAGSLPGAPRGRKAKIAA